MSCADFDDIKTICIELCKETEDRSVDTPSGPDTSVADTDRKVRR